MLHHLRVRNLGVLEDAIVAPSSGLTVITGETGAGKTLLLGGIRLLAGAKADNAAVGPFADQAEVEGLFSEGEELGASRVVPRDGRSRAYLDGALASSSALVERVGSLLDVVGQHDHLALVSARKVLSLIDGRLEDEGVAALGGYRETWSALRDARKRLEMIGGDQAALRRELDLVRFQAEEITKAGFQPGDDEHLTAQAEKLQNVDKLRIELSAALGALEEMAEQAGEAVSRLRKVATLDREGSASAGEMEGLSAQLSELTSTIRRSLEDLDLDPRHLEEIEARLTALGELKRKYGRTLEDVLGFGSAAGQRADELESMLGDAGQIEADVARLEDELAQRASLLSEARAETAERLGAEANRHLSDLALARASVSFHLEQAAPGADGRDQASLVFSSDPNLAPGPIGSVASGGELSRLVLAVRLAAREKTTRTLVFDEVDAGVGGATALALGAKLAALAEDTQVLCVTHLPQVAAHADAHFVVDRVDGKATVRKVEGIERVEEIARMLAGLPESEAGHQAAAELLATARG